MSGRGGNGPGTQHSPGGRLGFHQVEVGFPGWNTSHRENQSPAQTGGSVGKITFKCNIRQSHIFAVFPTAGDRGRKVGIPDPVPGPLTRCTRFPPGGNQVRRGRALPASPPGGFQAGQLSLWYSPGGEAKRALANTWLSTRFYLGKSSISSDERTSTR